MQASGWPIAASTLTASAFLTTADVAHPTGSLDYFLGFWQKIVCSPLGASNRRDDADVHQSPGRARKFFVTTQTIFLLHSHLFVVTFFLSRPRPRNLKTEMVQPTWAAPTN